MITLVYTGKFKYNINSKTLFQVWTTKNLDGIYSSFIRTLPLLLWGHSNTVVSRDRGCVSCHFDNAKRTQKHTYRLCTITYRFRKSNVPYWCNCPVCTSIKRGLNQWTVGKFVYIGWEVTISANFPKISRWALLTCALSNHFIAHHN